jgi:hypothetical protein
MERDKGIEPSPRPWQGRVLPLYESRRLRETAVRDTYSMPVRASTRVEAVVRAALVALGGMGQTSYVGPAGERGLSSPLPGCGLLSRWVTSSGVRRSERRVRGRCKRERTSRHRDSRRSPASGGADGADPGAVCWAFWTFSSFSRSGITLGESSDYRKFRRTAQVAN